MGHIYNVGNRRKIKLIQALTDDAPALAARYHHVVRRYVEVHVTPAQFLVVVVDDTADGPDAHQTAFDHAAT